MIIQISNGEVSLKDFMTRKIDKDYKNALMEGVENKIDADGKTEMKGFTQANSNKANEVALMGMIERIMVDGQELPITVETLDNMNVIDFEVLVAEINKITAPKKR